MPKCQLAFQRLKELLLKNEERIVFGLGFLLIAVLSFQAGYFTGEKNHTQPIVIEKPASLAQTAEPQVSGVETVKAEGAAKPETPVGDCLFVSSKNSNKVHLSSCRWAKQIKPENRVCFKTLEEALGQGKEPDKTCLK